MEMRTVYQELRISTVEDEARNQINNTNQQENVGSHLTKDYIVSERILCIHSMRTAKGWKQFIESDLGTALE